MPARGSGTKFQPSGAGGRRIAEFKAINIEAPATVSSLMMDCAYLSSVAVFLSGFLPRLSQTKQCGARWYQLCSVV